MKSKSRASERMAMKTEVSSNKRKYVLVFSLLVLGLFFCIICNSDVFDYSFMERLEPFSREWKSDSGVVHDIGDVRTGDYDGVVRLSKRLPEDISDGDELCFESFNSDVEIFVGDRSIYSFTAGENFTGRGYGYAFHTAQLSAADGGSILSVVYECVSSGGKRGMIRGVYIGSGLDYIHMTVLSRLFSAVISLIIAVFGLILMVIYAWISDKKRLPYDIASLGLGALLLGLWLFTDSNIMALLSGHIYVLRAINRISLALVPFPLVGFLNSLTKADRIIYRHVAFWSDMVFVGLLLILRFVGKMDMILFFYPGLIIYVVFIAGLLAVMFIDNRIYCRTKGLTQDLRYFFLAVTAFLVCAVTDLVIYNFRMSIGDSDGTFTRVGSLIILVGVMVGFLNWWNRDQSNIERDRLVNRALKYSISSNSPDDNIRMMMDFVGRELKAQRVVVLENTSSGKLHGTYAWYEEGRKPGAIDLLYIPYEGFSDAFKGGKDVDDRRLIVSNAEDYKSDNPPLYNLLVTNGIRRLTASSLRLSGRLVGVFAVIDPPQDKLEESSEVISLISYFVSQLIMRRDEEKRLRLYSYNDTLSGALNRMAYREYLRDGLNLSSPFGYLLCEIDGLEEVNAKRGYDAGDKMVVGLVNILMDVFGNDNVYRISGTEFVAFGFESDEAFFYNDVDRVKKMAGDKALPVFVGAVYCLYGTLDMTMVVNRANELLIEDRNHVNL